MEHSYHIKILIIIISSTWKFAATFPLAIYLFKMSFVQTLLYTNIGGIVGIAVFIPLSRGAIKAANTLFSGRSREKKRPGKLFTVRNRRLITLKNKYGLPGIILLTPLILSIPVGVFLITRYFGRKKWSYPCLALVQFLWSVVYTFLYTRIIAVV